MNGKSEINDFDEILKRIKTHPIGANRINSKNRKKEIPERNFCKAMRTAVLLLADGQWHKTSKIRTIAKINSVELERLCTECGIAQSDNGYWVCIPGDKTPEKAPGDME